MKHFREMEVEIISKENIKPSSPTPRNLRNYRLSLIDQIIPPIRVPFILYFPTNPHTFKNIEDFIYDSTQTLKQSLSKLLTCFYPFAGRMKDRLSIDCNDEGFLFVVAKTKSNLSDFLKKPHQKSNFRLLPCEVGWSEPGPETQVAMAQVNYFSCGGMAITIVFSHEAADGVTISSFIKSWSQYASGACKDVVCPNYILQSFFPQNEALKREYNYNSYTMKNLKIGKTVMRRYVFDSRAISTLKAQSGDLFRLSRFEVVTAFLWKCFISANKSTKTFSTITMGVNLRRKAQPLFPDNSFGNFFWYATPTSKYEDENDQLENLVRKIRDAINKIDDDLVMRMQGDEGLLGYCKNVKETWGTCYDKESAEILGVTSWCNFGLYNVDFGWGKPIWLNNCSVFGNDSESPYLDSIWLVDTKNGDGVEAWLSLEEEYMKAFDDIEELGRLAAVDPSPFDI